jgi:hypothetical protein
MADDVTEITIFIIVMELLKAPKLLSETLSTINSSKNLFSALARYPQV